MDSAIEPSTGQPKKPRIFPRYFAHHVDTENNGHDEHKEPRTTKRTKEKVKKVYLPKNATNQQAIDKAQNTALLKPHLREDDTASNSSDDDPSEKKSKTDEEEHISKYAIQSKETKWRIPMQPFVPQPKPKSSGTESSSFYHENKFSMRYVEHRHSETSYNQQHRRDQSHFNFHRKWISSNRAEDSKQRRSNFSIASYNVLADSACMEHKRELYPYCPDRYLEWDYRKDSLIHELQNLNVDILCLQEVDHYDFFQKNLSSLGYESIHKQRTGEFVDGCSIFWRKDSFALVTSNLLEFKKDKFMDRDNVAILAIFKHIQTGKKICVGTTHLLYNPKRGDVKLAQLKMYMDEAVNLMKREADEAIPLLLTGDFNVTPNSPICSFIEEGYLPLKNLNVATASGQLSSRSDSWRFLSPETLKTLADEGTEHITHNLELQSAYWHQRSYNDPFISSYHAQFRGTVDYIWYTSQVELLSVLGVPSQKHRHLLGDGLPNSQLSSDHLVIAAEFTLK